MLSVPADARRSRRHYRAAFNRKAPACWAQSGSRSGSALQKQIESSSRIRRKWPPSEWPSCVTEAAPKPADTFVFSRGNPHVPGDKVEPAFPTFSILSPTIRRSSRSRLPSRPAAARVLANWIASKDNPLTARVMVNRIWQHHFGRGIVRSPNDFGLQGDAADASRTARLARSRIRDPTARAKRAMLHLVSSTCTA